MKLDDLYEALQTAYVDNEGDLKGTAIALARVLQEAEDARQPVAWRWYEMKLGGEYRYDERPNPDRMCEPLYAAPQK